MERLTKYVAGVAHGAEGRTAESLNGSYCRGEFEATAIVDRLAAYEDTGLEPEEIEKIKQDVEDGYLKSTARRYGIDVSRLRELAQADREGRCVVLPFKPPRWVYMCSARFPKPAKAYYASAINVLQDMDNGCVFGDTPKEAEAALRREQDG